MRLNRRKFLLTCAGIAGWMASGCNRNSPTTARRYGGSIRGAAWKVGHLLRDGSFPPPTRTREEGVTIVGGGISGLAAGRHLWQSGFQNFTLLEMDEHEGGNSHSEHNSISSYPWGAHYVPLANAESTEITKLFEELNVITGRDSKGLPIYNEYFLCHDPEERLFIHGQWQDGLVPLLGIDVYDRKQYQSFFGMMEHYARLRGSDGKKAFAIPIDESSQDEEFLKLDALSMAAFMDQHGWDSNYLRWYVNYCCRDDYGGTMHDISAWAGIHYFASRTGEAANANPHTQVTWPEGNGWLVQQLRKPWQDRIHTSALVFNVEQNDREVFIDYYDVQAKCTTRIKTRAVVFAAPRFVATRVIRAWRKNPPDFSSFTYSPWMVANVSLDQLPTGNGAELSWDNVFFDSPSLGYVVATHQNTHPYPRETVLTYYHPLSHGDPCEIRREALSKPYEAWNDMIVKDLCRVHPGLETHITHLDVWLWGHGMIRPTPGFIWGKSRRLAHAPLGRIHFAHSDMSGISIFEEAFYHGIRAAEKTLRTAA